MIIQLTGDDITNYWDAIKFAALQVNPLLPQNLIERFSRNLLAKLMSNNYQCWMAISEDRKIKCIGITRILMDIGDLPYLLIDVIYGFEPTTDEEKADFTKQLVQFAKGIKCSRVITYTDNPMAINALTKKMGFTEIGRIFGLEVK